MSSGVHKRLFLRDLGRNARYEGRGDRVLCGDLGNGKARLTD